MKNAIWKNMKKYPRHFFHHRMVGVGTPINWTFYGNGGWEMGLEPTIL